MPSKNPQERSLTAKIAAAYSRGKITPEILGYQRDLRAARLAEYVESVVAQAPPLTEQQVDRIVSLLGRK